MQTCITQLSSVHGSHHGKHVKSCETVELEETACQATNQMGATSGLMA